MSVTTLATARKVFKLGLSLFRRGFNSSKCKTAAKMAVARIKLLRNKREAVVKQMRRDLALLLQSKNDATARVRVEHVIREQNVLAANEFIELFCELIVSRLPIIAKQRECPADLKEGIASIIFAAPRCSEIPELVAMRDIFEKKYGKDFVSAATDLRPNCGVNRMLIDKLSVRTPAGQVKLKVMKEIVKEYRVDWDTTESEIELLKPPEELIQGPSTFVSASDLPVKPALTLSVEHNKQTIRTKDCEENDCTHFQDAASAAQAAAESAKKAFAAAQAAAYLANKDINQATPGTRERAIETRSFDESHCSGTEEKRHGSIDCERIYRRHSYNAPSLHSDIKSDESDSDGEFKINKSIDCSHVIQDPRVHPKMPDYDALAARFEALKQHRKS